MTWWKLGWYTTLKFLQVCQMIMTYLKKIGSNGLNIDLSKKFFIIIKSLYQNLHFNIKQNFWETLHKLRTAYENCSSTLDAPCRFQNFWRARNFSPPLLLQGCCVCTYYSKILLTLCPLRRIGTFDVSVCVTVVT